MKASHSERAWKWMKLNARDAALACRCAAANVLKSDRDYKISKLATYSFFDNIPFMKALINRKEYIDNLLSYKEKAAAPLSVP